MQSTSGDTTSALAFSHSEGSRLGAEAADASVRPPNKTSLMSGASPSSTGSGGGGPKGWACPAGSGMELLLDAIGFESKLSSDNSSDPTSIKLAGSDAVGFSSIILSFDPGSLDSNALNLSTHAGL